ncbi:MAG: hypothetical protein M9911_07390 [Saprospiraceae bacterium]|jgi:hypothetical protein|nr:hypothetical protein [Saprospiraceae bacterium]
MKNFLRRLLLYLSGLSIGFLLLFTFTNYSTGEQTGHIIKLEKKGFVFKTWEGSLDRSIYQGVRPTKGNAENTMWSFSVESDKIAQAIQDANSRGNRVVLHYKEKYFRLFWVGDTKYIVTAIQEVQDNISNQTPIQTPQQAPQPIENKQNL